MKKQLLLVLLAIWAWSCSSKGGSDCKDVTGVCSETTNQSVAGKIVDADQKPVKNADVAVYYKTSSAAKKIAAGSAAAIDSLVATVKTKDDGTFLVENLPVGSFVLNAAKDSTGVAKDFSIAKDDKKDLGTLTLVNNGIIIGKVNRSIVQQADNAYALINEIGQQTTVTKEGDYTFNNVPVYNNYTITIYNGNNTVLPSNLDKLVVEVQAGKATQVDTAGKITVVPKSQAAKGSTIKVSSATLDSAAVSLPGGKFVATVVIDKKDTVRFVTDIKEGTEASLALFKDSLPTTGTATVQVQGYDASGLVIYEGKQNLDLSKTNLDSLTVPLAHRKASVVVKESASQTVFTNLAKIRSILVLDSAHKTVFKINLARTTSSAYTKIDSIPVGKGLVLQSSWLDADSTGFYTGLDTLDVLGAGKDTAFVAMVRKTGKVALTGSFLNSDSSALSGVVFDTAYVQIKGTYSDSLKASITPDKDGQYEVLISGIPAATKLSFGVYATSESGKRKFVGMDSVLVPANDTAALKLNAISGVDSKTPGFSVSDTTMELGDSATANLSWRNAKPETVALTLKSLNTTVVTINGSSFYGLRTGTANVVATVAGIALPDTFAVSVVEKEFSVADMTMEVDDTAKAVLKWKTKAPATYTVSYRSLSTTLATVVSTSGLVTAVGAGTAQIIATVTNITKPDTFAVKITEPFRDFSIKSDANALSATQGGDASTVIRLTRTKLKAAITLSITGAPDGVTAVINPATLTTDSSKITFNCNQNPFPGTYKIYLLGKTTGFTDRKDSLVLTILRDNSIVWKKIASGYGFNCGINDSAFAYCWGDNAYGQIGIGSIVDQTRPIRVSGTQKWKDISAGYSHSCGVTTDGEGFCWGQDYYGGLGDGGTATQTAPVPVSVSGGDRWNSITAGMHYSCGVTTDGRAFCWGYNGYGQLGNNTTTNTTTRLQVEGTQAWKTVQAGAGYTTCGLTASGEAYCWGLNTQGTIGDGNSGNGANPLPVKVSGSKTWLQLSVGANYSGSQGHACGITAANDMYCWGYNAYGSLGIGNTTTQLLPSLVLNDIKWQSVGAGYGATCGLNTAGKGFCWGWNGYGQVGNGTTANAQSSPAAVAGPYNWKSISSGSGGTCAISEFDQVYCWGNSALGAGSTTTSYVPWRVSEPLAQ